MKNKKFIQVLLYVLNKVGGKPNVGLTVLNKLMYFIDFDYFEKYGKSITGITYKKNHHGPTFDFPIEKLENKSILKLDEKFKRLPQKKYIALIEPDLSNLSAQEIKHIDNVLNKHSDKTARQIENYSHGDIPWIVTEKGKNIEYEAVFYRDEKYSVRDIDLDDAI